MRERRSPGSFLRPQFSSDCNGGDRPVLPELTWSRLFRNATIILGMRERCPPVSVLPGLFVISNFCINLQIGRMVVAEWRPVLPELTWPRLFRHGRIVFARTLFFDISTLWLFFDILSFFGREFFGTTGLPLRAGSQSWNKYWRFFLTHIMAPALSNLPQ